MASAVARVYEGLGAESPAGSRAELLVGGPGGEGSLKQAFEHLALNADSKFAKFLCCC